MHRRVALDVLSRLACKGANHTLDSRNVQHFLSGSLTVECWSTVMLSSVICMKGYLLLMEEFTVSINSSVNIR